MNAAFSALPDGTVDTLLKPENKDALVNVLTYHVVPGRWTYSELNAAVKKGKGMAELKTANGEWLTAKMNGPNNIILTDGNGGMANVTVYDVLQSNGVIHSIDHVLLPKS